MKGCGWNNHAGHKQYRSGCPYCTAVAGVEGHLAEAMRHALGAMALAPNAKAARDRASQILQRALSGEGKGRRHCATCGALEGGQHDASSHPDPLEWLAASRDGTVAVEDAT